MLVKIFSEAERSIIKNMMLSTSHKDIAALIGCTEKEVAEIVSSHIAGTAMVTYQVKLNERNFERKIDRAKIVNAAKIEREKNREQKIKNKNHRIEIEQHRKNSRREPSFKTREVDFTEMMSVRIDSKTVLQVKKGSDIEALKKRYSKKVKKHF